MNRDVPFETVEKWRSLVDLVYKLTIAGKMAWAESAKEGEIVAPYAGHAIVLTRKDSTNDFGDEEPIINVRINDSGGDVVDSFWDSDLDENKQYAYYRKLDNLMKTVGRKLTGADDVLDALLARMREDSGERADFDDEIPF
ncbi:hypothetical protein [Paracoccus sphaerophysae]|uniref:hypothetical protein n=1 Tax=Paracoccus sphaerophysae TaxID=690417 RepID=UPI0012EBB717|nr:hypothetical protein [Paracoccus sphaerophysae]